MDPTHHLDPETLYALLDGELGAEREGEAEGHLLRCPACRALHAECGATTAALRWYAAAPPVPPEGYWEEFWERWTPGRAARAPGVVPFARRLRIPLTAAAALAAIVGGVWTASRIRPDAETVATAPVDPPASRAIADPEWARDYEVFERLTVAVGSVDPLSKGMALASFAAAAPSVPEEPPVPDAP